MKPELTETDELIEELNSIMEEHKPSGEKVVNLFTKSTKTTSGIKEVSVQSSPSRNSKEDLWLKFVQATVDFQKLEGFYNKLSYTKNKGERNIKIYLDKTEMLPRKGYNKAEINEIVTIKTRLDKRQINRIVKKIAKKLKKN